MKSPTIKERSGFFFIGLIIVFSAFSLLLGRSPLFAQMQEVSENDLSQVYAQAGVSYNWGNSLVNITYDSFRISDTDHRDINNQPTNWLEFNNVSISGPGGGFTLDESTNANYPWLYQFNNLDIGTVTTGNNQTRTVVQFSDATNTNPRTWSIGNLVFCNQDLGSIQFDIKDVDPSLLSLTTHGVGASGIEFEYLSNWKIDNFTYTYNANPVDPMIDSGKLSLSGIHVAESATGAPDDPSTWAFSGQFHIGDIRGGTIPIDNNPSNTAYANPATFDVATTSDGITSIYLNLPMKGTIRAESVNFGGANFGPVAIDGITAHYIAIRLNPGN
jgi:hypothetical protein